jgi:hypothetical protein
MCKYYSWICGWDSHSHSQYCLNDTSNLNFLSRISLLCIVIMTGKETISHVRNKYLCLSVTSRCKATQIVQTKLRRFFSGMWRCKVAWLVTSVSRQNSGLISKGRTFLWHFDTWRRGLELGAPIIRWRGAPIQMKRSQLLTPLRNAKNSKQIKLYSLV